jgi:two-component system sensor histidine kinase KdpD
MRGQPDMDGSSAKPTAPQADGASEPARRRGKLKIFLSYAPGTGKTLAMLQDAYRRRQEGTDVVVGFVDAQGDLQAARLLEYFEATSKHVKSAAGITYLGLNLDLLLDRAPELVLVDHLARVNPPGLRHVARYLEVEELLAAGIDVYATLNVYQIESQVDAVTSLTGVTVRDVAPDRLLDEAAQLEVVDRSPQELLARYAAGQISFPPRAQVQMERFFQAGSLFGLRELALRYAARRSNALMRAYLAHYGMAGEESASHRLLVCINASDSAARLIRAGRRMADETRSEWTVIYVETPDAMGESEERQVTVARNMRLAELLGASTEVLPGRSVLETIHEYAQQNHIRRIMVGRSASRPWYRLLGVTVAEQLLRRDPTLSLYIVGSDPTAQPFQMKPLWKFISRLQLLASLALVVLPTLLGIALSPTIISRSANLIMLYMLAIVIGAVFLGPIPALLTAVLSILAFDFFFIPPLFRLFDFAPEYTLTSVGLLAISILVSTLVSRERALARAARRRAGQVTQLYELSRDLAAAVDMPEILKTVQYHVQRTFDRDMVILLPKNGYLVLSASTAGTALDGSELTAAEWAFQQGRPAGHNTGTFSYAGYRYFPLETSRGIIGVMGLRMADETLELHPEQMRQLGAYVTKAASAIERALFAEEASQAEILRATEKLQTALLNSISHDLRTPLASITGVLDTLRMEEGFLDAQSRSELVETAYGEAGRLNRLVGNLLDMSRLESGNMRISLQPCDVSDLIGAALDAVGMRLEGHPVTVAVPPDLPLAPLDYVLINQVLINLLDNAAKYSPEGGGVRVCAEQVADNVLLAVEDEGPGIPEDDLQHVFEKFFRVKRFENVVGTGLGLSICKGIVEVHGGKIWAENRQDGGTRLAFTLPLQAQTPTGRLPDVEPLHEEMRT